MRVRDGDLPQELVQYGVGEGGILPRAELKQLLRVLLRVRLLDQLLEITVQETVMDINKIAKIFHWTSAGLRKSAMSAVGIHKLIPVSIVD